MNSGEKISWLRLARTESVGPITFARLLAKYKSPDAALEALPILTKNKPIRIATAMQAEDEMAALQKIGGRMILLCDADYPQILSSIEDAPPVLSVIGNASLLEKQSVAIVGSRNASLNARKLAQKMAADLGQGDMVVTSGLARGIDTAAHEGAISSGTIAVVAGGVDVVYPKENTGLYKQICEGGLVLSECAIGTQPLAQHFPKRNRIVSGISLGTVVVEASLRSGSLITARMAAEQGRDVMAVPGFPSDPRSEGTNALIRDGVTLVRDAQDVVEQIHSFLKTPRDLLSLSPDTPDTGLAEEEDLFPQSDENLSELILPELSSSPILIDELIRSCNLKSSAVQSALMELELEGTIQRLPGNRVCRV